MCDTRTYSGEIAASFAGNTVAHNLLTSGLVTFTRNSAALDATMLPRWQYLHGAIFTIADSDGILADAWIDHPVSVRFSAPVPMTQCTSRSETR